jgi:hypothetical protein
MGRLSAALDAARARNGFDGQSKPVEQKKGISVVDFISTLKKISPDLSVQQVNPGKKAVTVQAAVFPQVQRSTPVQPKKTVGNYIDCMA